MWKKMTRKSFFYKKDILYILMFFKSNFLNYKFLFINNNKTTPFFNFSDFLKSLFDIFFWIKIRTLYYVNNWVYTTNHKRIAVNYFWFVILSGIVGMVLATLIRLEFAYPGVGVFAGDSLQYLSMATAHGVIMVFFMIIPLLLGAFANFLIPTQLGVHDVAFPRLNSAAFWFLPGGLLMLCQLVCIDRRYQRMNCFNIREIQSILKRKFFVDLINTHDHHTILNKTAMGLRFKTNNINSMNSNMFIFYNYGIEFSPKIRSSQFSINSVYNSQDNFSFFNLNSFFFKSINFFNNFNLFNTLNVFSLWLLNSNNFNLTSVFILPFSQIITALVNLGGEFCSLIVESVTDLPADVDSALAYLSFETFSMTSLKHFILVVLFYPIVSPLPSEITHTPYDDFKNLLDFISTTKNEFNIAIDEISSSLRNFKMITLPILPSLDLRSLFLDFFFVFKNTNIINFYNYYSIFFFNSKFNFFNFQLFNIINNQPSSLNEINISEKYSSFNLNLSSNNLKDASSINTYSSNLNYDSYFIYFYLFFNFFSNLPFFFISFFKNIFNLDYFFQNFSSAYLFLTTWYFPSLLNDNLFYFFFKNSNFSSFNFNYVSFYENLLNLLNSNNSLFSNYFFEINFKNFFLSFYSFLNLFLFNTLFNFFEIFYNFTSSINPILFGTHTNKIFTNIYKYLNTDFNSLNSLNSNTSLHYTSKYFNNVDSNFNTKYSNEESSNSFRHLRFYNPVFKYDYKSGDYFSKIQELLYGYLFTTISDITSSVRTSPWFFSENYWKAFNDNFSNYYTNISIVSKFDNVTLHQWDSKRFSNTDAFYNFFYTLSNDFNYTNKKWISLNSLNQKFYRMFNTSSMQQRIYSNWRQLKFTREAWRCKLLAARHQKTLFRRYVHEDGVFWSIERNAKDLLPGWAMITPFSSRTRFTAVGKTDIGLMGVFLVLNSSIVSAANFLVTYRYLSTLNNRKMRDARVFFTESVIIANWMMIFANPMLAIAILMLLSDRHWQTSFFDYSGGGDAVLFQHMFWFFGHPEVYIIILPTFGFVNSMISYYLRKRVSARASLMYSMYTIAFLGFFVWGHHMYMVGLSHTTRMLFSTLTVMISVPAATKIMHWCVTTVNSAIALELPLLFTFTFIFLFVSGGISGMCVAHTGMDILFHDTFYVIGHFHVLLAGAAMFGSFGAFYFYFPAIFGVKFSRIYAYLHYTYYLIGQLMTVIPMFWLGYAGMPRRVLDYPASMGGWHSVISAGHMLSVAGLMAFFIMIFDSLRQGRAVTRNTFGISRYNTRLNFYLYEISKISYVQQKGFFLFKFLKPTAIKLNEFNYTNFEPYETTIITYTFEEK